MNYNQTTSTRERFEEAAREIGVLLLAFAPLDLALAEPNGPRWGMMVVFVSLGVVFFSCALIAERRRNKRV